MFKKIISRDFGEEELGPILERYEAFLENCHDVTKTPIKVFNPLPKKGLAEIDLIREISRELQKKKEEDAIKAAQVAAEAEEAEKKAAAEQKEQEQKAEETKTEN